jgi:hypothetical protein
MAYRLNQTDYGKVLKMKYTGKLEGCAEKKEPVKIYEGNKITSGIVKKPSK